MEFPLATEQSCENSYDIMDGHGNVFLTYVSETDCVPVGIQLLIDRIVYVLNDHKTEFVE